MTSPGGDRKATCPAAGGVRQAASAAPSQQVTLFVPCFVEHLQPEVGQAAVRCLARLGRSFAPLPESTCCGQAAYNAGHLPAARAAGRHFLAAFPPGDGPVLALSGSCGAYVRDLLPGLLEGAERRAAEAIAARLEEVTVYLDGALAAAPELAAPFAGAGPLGASRPVACHVPCHAERGFGTGRAALSLLARAGVTPLPFDASECCGFGGVFAVKFPELSAALGRRKLGAARQAGAELLLSPEASCLLHLAGLAARDGGPLEVEHLLVYLDERARGAPRARSAGGSA